ncbi:PD-(D/E)XK nuclease family transposase [Longibaculum muris]|uniref:Putative transposase/invertase (TIGR01784 family) n=2 Tax=Longibaculum muris TaxID=1796628 RepID=A0A4R3YYI1_9FIRM|nr:PD-(D/E)XK nuclease family transposase [Longibaculum muris]MCR1888228.1 PD-(D/E)XK nuclease family transposase [Longibaculum muris]TCV96554.1 putative transposase/invertase (TIGR01784 family) [Longibaculum muris]
MSEKNYYVSDVFFKLTFGQNTSESKRLREFLLKNIIPLVPIHDLSVANPELTPQMIRMKNNILDIHMQNNQYEIDMEMQNSKMSVFLNRRFIHYSCRLIDYQLEAGDTSGKLKELIQIVFIRDIDKRCPRLMDDFYAKNTYNISQLGYLQTTIYVYLPYVNKIASEKECLSEFEALIYLMENGNVEGIKYEEKEGMIKMMKKKYNKFIKDKKMVKEVDARYQVQYDFQEWHDVDVEYAKKAGLEEGLLVGKKAGLEEGLLVGKKVGLEQGLSEGKLEMAIRIYEMKYHQDGEWLKECTQEQLDYFSQLILTDIESSELKEKIMNLVS